MPIYHGILLVLSLREGSDWNIKAADINDPFNPCVYLKGSFVIIWFSLLEGGNRIFSSLMVKPFET